MVSRTGNIFAEALYTRQNCVTSLPREAQAVFTVNLVSRESRISSKLLVCETVNSFRQGGGEKMHRRSNDSRHD